jgi:hypothetical protein
MVLQSAETSEVEFLSCLFVIDNTEPRRINIFPNPATSILTARYISGTIELYSLDGGLILQQDTGEGKKDIQQDNSSFENGTYIVRNPTRVTMLIKK